MLNVYRITSSINSISIWNWDNQICLKFQQWVCVDIQFCYKIQSSDELFQLTKSWNIAELMKNSKKFIRLPCWKFVQKKFFVEIYVQILGNEFHKLIVDDARELECVVKRKAALFLIEDNWCVSRLSSGVSRACIFFFFIINLFFEKKIGSRSVYVYARTWFLENSIDLTKNCSWKIKFRCENVIAGNGRNFQIRGKISTYKPVEEMNCMF